TLNCEGKYTVFYVSLEDVHSAYNNIEKGMEAILGEMRIAALEMHPELTDLIAVIDEELPNPSIISFRKVVAKWAVAHYNVHKKRIVLFIDEIDALVNNTLVSLLSQIRA